MQVLFKTRYEDDLRFLAKTGEKVRVGLVVALLIAAPLFLQNYYLSELGLLLVYAIAGIGLMILTGHTGQVSFGHAAVPFLVSAALTVALSGLVGMALGRSASKMHGFYLAIATLAFLILVETLLGEWEAVTGGHAGFKVPALQMFGIPLKAVWQQYYVDLFFLMIVVLGAANLFRTPTGRSFLAVRDSELSARSLGVNVEWVKIQSFGVSAAITGLAGVLLAHHLSYLSPEVFSVLESLKLMLMIVVGGLGSILGAIFGAILISLLPISISFLKDVLPPEIGQQAGLEPLLFGLIIVIFIVFEPQGIYGRWMKLRFFFETFPYYRKSSFVRQKSYLKTERMR
jgi:branched-chain amino acid transport system permease protein